LQHKIQYYTTPQLGMPRTIRTFRAQSPSMQAGYIGSNENTTPLQWQVLSQVKCGSDHISTDVQKLLWI